MNSSARVSRILAAFVAAVLVLSVAIVVAPAPAPAAAVPPVPAHLGIGQVVDADYSDGMLFAAGTDALIGLAETDFNAPSTPTSLAAGAKDISAVHQDIFVACGSNGMSVRRGLYSTETVVPGRFDTVRATAGDGYGGGDDGKLSVISAATSSLVTSLTVAEGALWHSVGGIGADRLDGTRYLYVAVHESDWDTAAPGPPGTGWQTITESLKVVDVSNPAAPHVVGHVDLSQWADFTDGSMNPTITPTSVAVRPGSPYIYVGVRHVLTGGQGGFFSVNVSDPAHPHVAGRVAGQDVDDLIAPGYVIFGVDPNGVTGWRTYYDPAHPTWRSDSAGGATRLCATSMYVITPKDDGLLAHDERNDLPPHIAYTWSSGAPGLSSSRVDCVITPNGDGWTDYAVIGFRPDRTVRTTLWIYDMGNRFMTQLLPPSAQGPTTHSIRWGGVDGWTQQGGDPWAPHTPTLLRDGAYRYHVWAENAGGGTWADGWVFILHDLKANRALFPQPVRATLYGRVYAVPPSFKPRVSHTDFRFTLTQKAYVSCYVFTSAGPTAIPMGLATYESGSHQIDWRGEVLGGGWAAASSGYRFLIYARDGGTDAGSAGTGVVTVLP